MQVIRSNNKLAEAIESLRHDGKTIALVPTMGALHAGHLSLIDIARNHADTIVVSIYVNPTQFGQGEDFANYPRTETDDLGKLKKANIDIAWLPSTDDIYPNDLETTIHISENTDILCGAFRPGHFDGVTTVVSRLFELSTPDIAIFGEKDYQQLQVINQMVEKYGLPIKIISAPIARESDGLALSSRNTYLSDAERQTAPELYKTLLAVKEKLENDNISDSLSWGISQLIEKGFTKIDYLEIRDEASLAMVKTFDQPARLFAAAYLGNTRLIDNIPIG